SRLGVFGPFNRAYFIFPPNTLESTIPPTSPAFSIASTESARQSKSISGRAEQELIGRRFEFGGVAEQFLAVLTARSKPRPFRDEVRICLQTRSATYSTATYCHQEQGC